MFRSLIEDLRDALNEGPEGHRLMPFSQSAEKIRQANELLKRVRREAGGSGKPDVKTKPKILLRLGAHRSSDS